MKTENQKKCKTLISWDAKTLALMNACRTIDGWNKSDFLKLLVHEYARKHNVEVPDGK